MGGVPFFCFFLNIPGTYFYFFSSTMAGVGIFPLGGEFLS